jgi:hypothetical protein
MNNIVENVLNAELLRRTPFEMIAASISSNLCDNSAETYLKSYRLIKEYATNDDGNINFEILMRIVNATRIEFNLFSAFLLLRILVLSGLVILNQANFRFYRIRMMILLSVRPVPVDVNRVLNEAANITVANFLNGSELYLYKGVHFCDLRQVHLIPAGQNVNHLRIINLSLNQLNKIVFHNLHSVFRYNTLSFFGFSCMKEVIGVGVLYEVDGIDIRVDLSNFKKILPLHDICNQNTAFEPDGVLVANYCTSESGEFNQNAYLGVVNILRSEFNLFAAYLSAQLYLSNEAIPPAYLTIIYIKMLIMLSFNENITYVDINNVMNPANIQTTLDVNGNALYTYNNRDFCLLLSIPQMPTDRTVENLTVLNVHRDNTMSFIEQYFFGRLSCNHLFFYGFSCVTRIGNNFLSGADMESVHFNNFVHLQQVGDAWMTNCAFLVTPDFNGLSKLQTVGSFWLNECEVIQNVFFTGLSELQSVGNDWMRLCDNLESPNFNGLINLYEVGNNWMAECISLTEPSFAGLMNLQTVGSGWLCDCENLENPVFNVLNRLRIVGDEWLRNCENLVNPTFDGLSELQSVGAGWMMFCHSLVSPNFTALISLTSVRDEWMGACADLDSVFYPVGVNRYAIYDVDDDFYRLGLYNEDIGLAPNKSMDSSKTDESKKRKRDEGDEDLMNTKMSRVDLIGSITTELFRKNFAKINS